MHSGVTLEPALLNKTTVLTAELLANKYLDRTLRVERTRFMGYDIPDTR